MKLYKNQKAPSAAASAAAVMIHGSGIAGPDMAAATIKMNDDVVLQPADRRHRHRYRRRIPS